MLKEIAAKAWTQDKEDDDEDNDTDDGPTELVDSSDEEDEEDSFKKKYTHHLINDKDDRIVIGGEDDLRGLQDMKGEVPDVPTPLYGRCNLKTSRTRKPRTRFLPDTYGGGCDAGCACPDWTDEDRTGHKTRTERTRRGQNGTDGLDEDRMRREKGLEEALTKARDVSSPPNVPKPRVDTPQEWRVVRNRWNKRRYKTWDEREKADLALLATIEPEGVHAIKAGRDEWEEIVIYVDSGASETVMGANMLEGVETKEGAASKRGVRYQVANGVMIDNLGEKRFMGTSVEGIARGLIAQVADVNKALLSVSRLVKGGHRVVFDEESYIEDKQSGERMWLREDKGMYALTLWVKNDLF